MDVVEVAGRICSQFLAKATKNAKKTKTRVHPSQSSARWPAESGGAPMSEVTWAIRKKSKISHPVDVKWH